jgi:hypothetical protein
MTLREIAAGKVTFANVKELAARRKSKPQEELKAAERKESRIEESEQV